MQDDSGNDDNGKDLLLPDKSAKKQVDTQFKKGQSGNKNGRPPGIKNKRTLKIEQELLEGDCNPIQGMIRMVKDEATEPSIRAKLFCELASYIYPKRKAIEHTGADGDPLEPTKIIVERVMPPQFTE